MQIQSLMMMTFLIFLSSCGNGPTTRIVRQCSVRFHFDDQDEIDVSKSKCLCRDYEYSKTTIGPVNSGNNEKLPLRACHKLIGNLPNWYLEIINFLDEALEHLKSIEERAAKKGIKVN